MGKLSFRRCLGLLCTLLVLGAGLYALEPHRQRTRIHGYVLLAEQAEHKKNFHKAWHYYHQAWESSPFDTFLQEKIIDLLKQPISTLPEQDKSSWIFHLSRMRPHDTSLRRYAIERAISEESWGIVQEWLPDWKRKHGLTERMHIGDAVLAYLSYDWVSCLSALERAIQLEPANSKIWEAFHQLAISTGDKSLLETSECMLAQLQSN